MDKICENKKNNGIEQTLGSMVWVFVKPWKVLLSELYKLIKSKNYNV